jgi:cobalamin biosynthesis protein CobT
MPAPGPKDGHASKASRDLQLTRGTSAKSNGFKYGGGTLDGATSVRTGISNSARDQLSRRKLREKFLARKRKREEEEEEEKERDERRGTKGDETAKRRSGDDEEEDDESENENENKNKRRRTEQTESEAKEKEEEEKEETDAVTSSITFPWTCDVCERKTMQSDHQRNDHLNSKKHKKNVAKRRGRELLKTMLGTS